MPMHAAVHDEDQPTDQRAHHVVRKASGQPGRERRHDDATGDEPEDGDPRHVVLDLLGAGEEARPRPQTATKNSAAFTVPTTLRGSCVGDRHQRRGHDRAPAAAAHGVGEAPRAHRVGLTATRRCGRRAGPG